MTMRKRKKRMKAMRMLSRGARDKSTRRPRTRHKRASMLSGVKEDEGARG